MGSGTRSASRLIGGCAVMFVLALTYASSGFAPLTSANERSRDSGSKTDPKKHDGKEIFRFDTFGDEQFWTDVLRMHEAISDG